jgi:hypothetical protein
MKLLRLGLSVACLIMAGCLAVAGPAAALKICVPKAQNASMVTPENGKCKHGYGLMSLGAQGNTGPQGKSGAEGKPGAGGTPGATGPEGKAGGTGSGSESGLSSSEVETLKAILPFIKFVSSGVGGKPTVQFSGVNVQVVNGLGKTETTNGAGNLVVGYDETANKQEQTGSHDLILGSEQTFTSYQSRPVLQAIPRMEPTGIEPVTSCLQSRRSPS